MPSETLPIVRELRDRPHYDTRAKAVVLIEMLVETLEPFTILDDVNMNDPLSKWLTVAQIKGAVAAYNRARSL